MVVDVKEYRPLQTSGFAMSADLFLMWVLRRTDIRDLQLVECPNVEITIP